MFWEGLGLGLIVLLPPPPLPSSPPLPNQIGRNADWTSPFRPLTPQQEAAVDQHVEETYKVMTHDTLSVGRQGASSCQLAVVRQVAGQLVCQLASWSDG